VQDTYNALFICKDIGVKLTLKISQKLPKKYGVERNDCIF